MATKSSRVELQFPHLSTQKTSRQNTDAHEIILVLQLNYGSQTMAPPWLTLSNRRDPIDALGSFCVSDSSHMLEPASCKRDDTRDGLRALFVIGHHAAAYSKSPRRCV